MDFSYTDEQRSLVEVLRRVFADLGPSVLLTVDGSGGDYSREAWRSLGDLGVLRADVIDGGGDRLGLTEVMILAEEVGRAAVPVPLIGSIAGGTLPLRRFASGRSDELLERVEHGTASLTAPLYHRSSTGSLQATRTDEGWLLRGELTCVPDAFAAERMLVIAVEDEQVHALLVPLGEGVSMLEQRGTVGEELGAVSFFDAPVAADALVGEPGQGGVVWQFVDAVASVMMCASVLGSADAALAMTAHHVREREQFGRPIGSFQAVAQRLADCVADIEAMRLSLWYAVSELERGQWDTDALDTARFWAVEGGQRVVHAAQHLHGGIGVDLAYGVHRHFLWVKHVAFALGPSPVFLDRLGTRVVSA